MTLNGYLALNSVFVPVWLAETVQLSKNNCGKNNKDRHMLSAAKIFGRDSIVSGNMKFVLIFTLIL